MTHAQTTSETYPVPEKAAEAETEIRRSRFIARAVPVASRDEALDVVERARRDHPQARHHCWAYVIGAPGRATSAAMNDDGEPSGTAGKPILGVIEHKAIGDIAVVVIRYFGGVKLGAGGLVRAYAGATEAVLSALPVCLHEPGVSLQVAGGFADEQPLRLELERLAGELMAIDYGQGVEAWVSIPQASLDAFQAWAAARGIRAVTTTHG